MTAPAILAKELQHLRSEVRRLRNSKRPPPKHRILERAFNDATYMLKLAAVGESYSRDDMLLLGMSERRWTWAMGLLRHARMAYRYGESGIGIKPVDDLEELAAGLRTLDNHVRHLRNTGSPYLYELRMHMPRKYRREP